MRKAMLGLFLVVPWPGLAPRSAEAPPARQQGIGGTVKVQANSVMRLPKRAQELRLRRVEIGEDAALLIPLEVSVLRIEELHMAKNARIGVAPGEERISIEVVSGRLADGSIISAPGATGTFRQSAGNGRDLTLRLQAVEVESLLLDARGGVGAPGYDGLDGASGKASGCLWGSALKGGDGQSGSDGGQAGRAVGFVWKCRAIFLWSACKPVCKAASAALEARPANRVRRITPPVAGSTRWMPVVRGAAERTARTAPTAATAAWTSCASEERPAARLPAHRRFRGSGVPLPGLSATGRGAG